MSLSLLLVGTSCVPAQAQEGTEEPAARQFAVVVGILFYFVGHGVGGDFDDPYLLAYDSDPSAVQSTSIHVKELGQSLQTWIPAGNFALITDAAHEGTLDGLALLGPSAQSWPDMGSSTFQLSASALREVGKEGAFAPHFIDAVTGGADTDKNGIVTASELRRYLVLAVPQATGNLQNPSDAGKYDGAMAISTEVSYKETLPELAAAAPDVVYITKTVESDPEVTERAWGPVAAALLVPLAWKPKSICVSSTSSPSARVSRICCHPRMRSAFRLLSRM